MKKSKLVALTTAGILLASFGGVKAFAEDDRLTNSENQTDTIVKIIDKDGKDDGDTVTTDELKLLHVPSRYDFETSLKSDTYEIISDSSKVTGYYDKDSNSYIKKIVVFNNSSNRKWQVKANISDLRYGETDVVDDNPALTINGKLISTKYQGIVLSNNDVKGTSGDQNGYYSTDINEIGITFKDKDKKITKNTFLKASVEYTLYATPNNN